MLEDIGVLPLEQHVLCGGVTLVSPIYCLFLPPPAAGFSSLDEAADDGFRCILVCVEGGEKVWVFCSGWVEGGLLEAGGGGEESGGAEAL